MFVNAGGAKIDRFSKDWIGGFVVWLKVLGGVEFHRGGAGSPCFLMNYGRGALG